MQHQKSEVLAKASGNCTICGGTGVPPGGEMAPCRCVLREVFRKCLAKFANCCDLEQPRHQYIADFLATAKRTLGGKSVEHRLFRLHYLLGGNPALVCRLMQIEMPTFYELRDRVVQALGRAFHETEPNHPVALPSAA